VTDFRRDGDIDLNSNTWQQGLTRRRLMQLSASGVALVGLGNLAAACGGGGSSSALAGSAGGAPKRGGNLRLGANGGAASDTLEAQNPILNTDFARVYALYDPLMTLDVHGKPQLVLAESIEPNADATEWTIRVRKGVVTHDGKPFGSKDVLFSFKRMIANKFSGSTSVGPIDLNASKVVDPHTVLLKYHQPYSILPQALSIYYFFMVPEGYDPKKPIGTGAFKYQSFQPGVQSVFVRNDNYWQSGLPYLDKLTIQNIADETSQVDALRSGQVDAINYLSATSVAAVQSSGGRLITSNTGAWGPFTMRVDLKPFTDVRVRQALRLVVDRPQMVSQLFGTYGTIGNDMFGIFDPDFDHSIPQRVQDIDQAKSLLKAAGQSNLHIQLVTSQFSPGMENAAEVFATQAKAAGVTVDILRQNTTDYFAKSYGKVPFSQDYWIVQPYLVTVSQGFVAGAPFPVEKYADPTYTALYHQASSTTDTDKQRDIVHHMLQIDHDSGPVIIPYFFPQIDAVSSKVGGVQPTVTGQALGNYDFKHMWFNQ
jgi:peptide/nickel transport system substrate-binding protein